jgi:hypothetical protein
LLGIGVNGDAESLEETWLFHNLGFMTKGSDVKFQLSGKCSYEIMPKPFYERTAK